MSIRYLVPCMILLVSCSQTYSFSQTDQMQRYFMQRLPVGTPVEQARRVLKSEGFNLSTITDVPHGEKGEIRQNVNYLSGYRSDGFVFVRFWQVQVLFNNDAVVEIHVQMREVSP